MICCDYEEMDAKTYKGIYIFGIEEKGSKSYTGDIVKDYKNIHNWLVANPQKNPVMISSSMDNFMMDSNEYDYEFNRKGQVTGIKKLNESKKSK